MPTPSFSIGIEEEYQIIDPVTRELKSYITEMLAEGKMVMAEQIKAELHQSIVEIGTNVCRTPAEARGELVRLRRGVMELAARKGLKIVAAGSHPFSNWQDQPITPFDRYAGVKQDMQMLAQQLLIFGTHVHIGIEDPEFVIDAMNVVRYMLPHVLALSTSSPFWVGQDTCLKSYRSIIFRNFPRTGIPPVFSSHGEFDLLKETLVRTGCIPDGTKIWWDARPNHNYPTLEFRICDVCTRVDEAVALAAIFQALIYKIWKMRRDNMTFRVYPTPLIDENKWRAVRYSLEGKLIDWGGEQMVPAADLIRELLAFVTPFAHKLNSEDELAHVETILQRGASAEQQVQVWKNANGDTKAVVDFIIAETEKIA